MKIISYGDDMHSSTGYGSIWLNLLPRLKKVKPKWEFYHVGWQNYDRPHETKEGIIMLPNDGQYGFGTVFKYLTEYNPDFMITCADAGLQGGFIEGVIQARKKGWKGKWIAYTPMDTADWEHLMWDKIFDIPDINLTCADFGEAQFTKNFVHNVKNIPLGVDTKIFYPRADRDEIRNKTNIGKKFIIGFVGKNQRRKMIPNLMKGFAQFSKGKNDVCLLLHSDAVPTREFQGWHLTELMLKYEREYDPELFKFNKIILSKINLSPGLRQYIQPEFINELYNMMDIFCFATGGEGFGIPGLECQSAGVPLMMTAYSTAFELTDNGKTGILIPILKDKYGRDVMEIGANGVQSAVPDDKQIANLLEIAYSSWKQGKLREFGEKARQFALKYDWDNIVNLWLELFESEV